MGEDILSSTKSDTNAFQECYFPLPFVKKKTMFLWDIQVQTILRSIQCAVHKVYNLVQLWKKYWWCRKSTNVLEPHVLKVQMLWVPYFQHDTHWACAFILFPLHVLMFTFDLLSIPVLSLVDLPVGSIHKHFHVLLNTTPVLLVNSLHWQCQDFTVSARAPKDEHQWSWGLWESMQSLF